MVTLFYSSSLPSSPPTTLTSRNPREGRNEMFLASLAPCENSEKTVILARAPGSSYPSRPVLGEPLSLDPWLLSLFQVLWSKIAEVQAALGSAQRPSDIRAAAGSDGSSLKTASILSIPAWQGGRCWGLLANIASPTNAFPICKGTYTLVLPSRGFPSSDPASFMEIQPLQHLGIFFLWWFFFFSLRKYHKHTWREGHLVETETSACDFNDWIWIQWGTKYSFHGAIHLV